MEQSQNIEVFDWIRVFLSNDHPVSYLWEIVFRTIVMFLFLIAILKFMSKRGVKQMSVFELAILIALGSACGDPMFYSHVPLSWGLLILALVMLLYKVITWFTYRFKIMETVLEGQPIHLLENGQIDYKNYKRVKLPADKFFAELRLRGVDHLGQVRKVYLETSGEFSVYFLVDEEVIAGLPIYPELLADPLNEIKSDGLYGCISCGYVLQLGAGKHECPVCKDEKWLPVSQEKRIA